MCNLDNECSVSKELCLKSCFFSRLSSSITEEGKKLYKKLLCILALTVFALDARIPEKKGEEEPKSVKKLKKEGNGEYHVKT